MILSAMIAVSVLGFALKVAWWLMKTIGFIIFLPFILVIGLLAGLASLVVPLILAGAAIILFGSLFRTVL